MKFILTSGISNLERFGSSPKTPNLNLAFIAAMLEKGNHEVKVWDLNILKWGYEQIKKNLEKEAPDWIGLTSSTTLVNSAWHIAEIAKKVANCKVILGGSHPTVLPEESAKRPEIDIVVRQEGEHTVDEIFNQKKDLKEIDGISYKKNGGTIVTHNRNRSFLNTTQLGDLPHPAWHLFPMDKYDNYQPFLLNRSPCGIWMSSRGCPMHCSFCAFREVLGRGCRTFPLDWVFEEWRRLVEDYHSKEIAVLDEAFTVDKERAKAICREVKKYGVPWSLSNGVRVDMVDEEIFKIMKDAGCYRLAFGLESGCQRILDRMHKETTLEKMRWAVNLAYKEKFCVVGFFMLGNIGENRQTMEDTIKFAKSLPLHYAQFTIASPVPGTEFYEYVKQHGTFKAKDWSEWGQYGDRPLFEMEEITDELVQEMAKKSYREFYMRPMQIYRLLTLKENWYQIGKRINTGLKFMGVLEKTKNQRRLFKWHLKKKEKKLKICLMKHLK